MADLDVQPKRKSPWWLWLLLALIALALIFFLMRGFNRDTAADTTASTGTEVPDDGWGSINFDIPAANYEEITDAGINVRGTDEYAIYSLDEPILFDTEQSTMRSGAEQQLNQVVQSMEKRFAGGQVRIYGYTDAKGSAGYNKELAEQRAQSVQNWLTQNGKIAADRITLHPVGESQPVASNATAEGRQQNRRVEIVIRRVNN